MKTMTCSQLGGTCDASMTAATAEEMATMGMEHVKSAHPEMAEQIEAMTDEEKATWMSEFHAKWDAASEDKESEAEAPTASEEEPAA